MRKCTKIWVKILQTVLGILLFFAIALSMIILISLHDFTPITNKFWILPTLPPNRRKWFCLQVAESSWSSPDDHDRRKAGIYELLHGRPFNGDQIVLQNIHSIKVFSYLFPVFLATWLLFPGLPSQGCTAEHPKQQDAPNEDFKYIDWHFEKEFDWNIQPMGRK